MTKRARGLYRWGRILLLLFAAGCGAAYTRQMSGVLKRMGDREYEAALSRLEKPEAKSDALLYRLEKGLILHYQKEYERSNREFEKAERLIDRRFTRSLSRELAAMVTNDAVRPYLGEEFERVLINYYRAMNYHYLGDPQAALVECRKANLKLEEYAGLADYELSYKNDAFVQYVTGLLYEAEDEWNDAYVSYKAAEKGYRAYRETFGLPMPKMLVRDLIRAARTLGFEEDAAHYSRTYGLDPDGPAPSGGVLVAFVESGFIARKHQYEIELPLLEGDDPAGVQILSDRLLYRYHHPYLYRSREVSYWLKIALPEYREVPSKVRQVRILGGGRRATGVLVEDLNAIALQNFEEKKDRILLRTVVRALTKYAAARGMEKAFDQDDGNDGKDWVQKGAGRLLGALVNLFGVATEAADTRSWLSLPGRIYMARLPLPPGRVDLTVELLDGRGRLVEIRRIPGVEIETGRLSFLNCRGYE